MKGKYQIYLKTRFRRDSLLMHKLSNFEHVSNQTKRARPYISGKRAIGAMEFWTLWTFRVWVFGEMTDGRGGFDLFSVCLPFVWCIWIRSRNHGRVIGWGLDSICWMLQQAIYVAMVESVEQKIYCVLHNWCLNFIDLWRKQPHEQEDIEVNCILIRLTETIMTIKLNISHFTQRGRRLYFYLLYNNWQIEQLFS